jgi:hypothetical protein
LQKSFPIVDAIRKIDPKRIIMIGGTQYNSVYALKDISVINDPNIVYTFHFYEPLIFTHQKAPWVNASVDYNKTLEYPGIFPDLDLFLKSHPEYESILGRYRGRKLDGETMRIDLQTAVEFMKKQVRNFIVENSEFSTRLPWKAEKHGLPI